MKNLFTILSLSFLLHSASAQIDLQCDGRDQHSLYMVSFFNSSADAFYRVDSVDTHPTLVKVATDTIVQADGISINKNLDTNSGAETFYAIGNDFIYRYWSGTEWVNTGHTSGIIGAINPGGTDNYIFNLQATVWRYDGTGDGTQLGNIVFYNPVQPDIATDRNGNFYILQIGGSAPVEILAFNYNGIPLDTFQCTGSGTYGGGGLAIVGSAIYASLYLPSGKVGLYEGIFSNHTVNFTLIDSFAFVVNDLASCPDNSQPLAVFKVPEAPHFVLFPNPATDVATVRLDNTSTLDVTDCMGRKIMSVETRGLTEYQLPVNNWGHGVYFITATSPNGLVARSTLLVQ